MTIIRESSKPLGQLTDNIIGAFYMLGYLAMMLGYIVLAGVVMAGVFIGLSFAAQALGITGPVSGGW